MKSRFILSASIISLTAVLLVTAGCGHASKNTSQADQFGTNKLETVFAEAGAPAKGAVQKAEASIKSADYGAAYDTLFTLSKDPSLSSDQMQALRNTMEVLGNYPRKAP